MTKRVLAWLLIGVLVTPLVLMAWYPDTFTIGFRYVLRYHLELVLPVSMQAYGLTTAHSRRFNQRSRVAFAAFCCLSLASFGYLAYAYTYRTYAYTYRVLWGVTVIPAFLFLAGSDLLSGKSRLLGHK
jgi:uncharacterized membrane protein YdfJ with MMPL/SSD domain